MRRDRAIATLLLITLECLNLTATFLGVWAIMGEGASWAKWVVIPTVSIGFLCLIVYYHLCEDEPRRKPRKQRKADQAEAKAIALERLLEATSEVAKAIAKANEAVAEVRASIEEQTEPIEAQTNPTEGD